MLLPVCNPLTKKDKRWLSTLLESLNDPKVLTKKGIQAASADFGLIAIAYNLKRLLNIKGQTLKTLFRSLRMPSIPDKK
jgi:hypothetical protein